MDANFLLLPEFETDLSGARRRALPRGRGVLPDRPSVQMRRVAAHEHVFREGDPAREVYELVQGAVLLVRALRDGRRQIVDVVGPGRLFGFTAAARHRCSAVVSSSALVCGLDLALAQRNPRVAERLEREMLGEIDRLRELALVLGRASALERVAGFFTAMVDGRGGSVEIDLPMNRGEIADHLGLTIETVSRQISRLRREGIIENDSGSRIFVLDPARLAALNGIGR